MSFIRKLRPDEVTFSVVATEEIQEPDPKMDPECLKFIKDHRNEVWPWCDIDVRAEWNGFTGTTSLGCCSYKSKKDFICNSGYYDDMCTEAIENLQKVVDKTADKLSSLVTQEAVESWLCEQTHEG